MYFFKVNVNIISLWFILVSSGFDIQDSRFATQDSGFQLRVQDSNNIDECSMRDICTRLCTWWSFKKNLLYSKHLQSVSPRTGSKYYHYHSSYYYSYSIFVTQDSGFGSGFEIWQWGCKRKADRLLYFIAQSKNQNKHYKDSVVIIANTWCVYFIFTFWNRLSKVIQ